MAAVAVHAARALIRPSLARASRDGERRARWLAYATLGVAAAAVIGPYLVLGLLGCGLAEVLIQRRLSTGGQPRALASLLPGAIHAGRPQIRKRPSLNDAELRLTRIGKRVR